MADRTLEATPNILICKHPTYSNCTEEPPLLRKRGTLAVVRVLEETWQRHAAMHFSDSESTNRREQELFGSLGAASGNNIVCTMLELRTMPDRYDALAAFVCDAARIVTQHVPYHTRRMEVLHDAIAVGRAIVYQKIAWETLPVNDPKLIAQGPPISAETEAYLLSRFACNAMQGFIHIARDAMRECIRCVKFCGILDCQVCIVYNLVAPTDEEWPEVLRNEVIVRLTHGAARDLWNVVQFGISAQTVADAKRMLDVVKEVAREYEVDCPPTPCFTCVARLPYAGAQTKVL